MSHKLDKKLSGGKITDRDFADALSEALKSVELFFLWTSIDKLQGSAISCSVIFSGYDGDIANRGMELPF